MGTVTETVSSVERVAVRVAVPGASGAVEAVAVDGAGAGGDGPGDGFVGGEALGAGARDLRARRGDGDRRRPDGVQGDAGADAVAGEHHVGGGAAADDVGAVVDRGDGDGQRAGGDRREELDALFGAQADDVVGLRGGDRPDDAIGRRMEVQRV